ncbi:recombinase family protein [Jiangella asiatica]|uniref:Recombinase family protein n=1 Tax=Jiangella asiatica TaxID=2530372 RepID=A0A4R5CIH0_9ACTN|nr:recombinase family protein [Jiangella asiatica]TDD98906.1 recombinase family protein [Jiangella asiatica]
MDGKRAVLYLRQSLDRTGDGAAVDRQRDACTSLAQARGLTVVEEYVDNSVSATNGARPRWTQLLADAEAGRYDVIMAWSLDRLTRGVADMERLVVLCERAGIAVVTVQGDLDLATDSGRLVGRILTAVARGEVERKSSRQVLANAQRARQGRPPQGPRAFGYSSDGMELVPVEAELVRCAFEKVAAGGSVLSIVRAWEGHTTTWGRPWTPRAVRTVLANPRYAALRSYRGEVVGEGAWPAIVDEELWRLVQGILSDPERRVSPGTERTYLLTGLATCGVCGGLIRAGGLNHGNRTYRCASKSHVVRAAGPVDDFVTAVVCERLGRPDVADLVAAKRPDVGALHTEAATLRQRRDQLAVLFADGELTASQLRVGTERLDGRLEQLDGQLAAAARESALLAFAGAEQARAVWEGLDLQQRRAVIAELMTVKLLSPGRGIRTFRPESVLIQPRS